MIRAFQHLIHFGYVVPLLLGVFSCDDGEKSDAYGNFEATTVTVSAKGSGEMIYLDIEEGQYVELGQEIGLIDTTQLHLEKQQLKAQVAALSDKTQEATPQIEILEERKENLIRERNRTQALLQEKAATQKQLDDYNGEIEVIDQQISATQREIDIANRGILAENKPLQAQIKAIENRIRDHHIYSPLSGTVLNKLAEPGEYMMPGVPLFKIANLQSLKLRAYTSATLLQDVSLNDTVTVLVDKGKEDYKRMRGTVIWIASEAEFTPETIETKEERVNLVYALDILVSNDGMLKIGMPGEVQFQQQQNNSTASQ